MHAGQLAFELERNEEAAAKYRTALSRAQVRDDPDAIADTGYNFAVAELRANAPISSHVSDAYANAQSGSKNDNLPYSKRERSSAKTNGKNGSNRPRKGWS